MRWHAWRPLLQRISLQKRANGRHQHLVLVFQHVVIGIVERGDLGLRKRTAEAGSREILLVDAQEEFVDPTTVFQPERL